LDALIQLSENLPLLSSSVERCLVLSAVRVTADSTRYIGWDRLHQHTSVEAVQLLDNSDIVRRLKRVKPFELV
jgi:hypothetical protein